MNTALAAPAARASARHGMMSASPPPGPNFTSQLDLRPPSEFIGGGAANDMSVFPSTLHRHSLAAFTQSDREQNRFTNLGAELSTARTTASLEGFAQRVRRQGLPIARLWQNKSALVSLGLNQRGKPGLWIMQKVH